MSNYIDDLALDIYFRSEGGGKPTKREMPLYRMYALLALAKGKNTSAKDVHDAWAAWCAEDRPQHPALVPFNYITKEVQALDDPYVSAIHRVAYDRTRGGQTT